MAAWEIVVTKLGDHMRMFVTNAARAASLAFAATMATLLATASAGAATIISGKYIVTVRKYCEPTQTIDSTNVSGAVVVDAVMLGGSDVGFSMFTVSFNPNKLTLTTNGLNDEGNVMLMKYTGVLTGQSGDPFSESATSDKGTYSNTDTTITVGNQTLNAMYGQVDKNGIAHFIAFQGIFNNENNVPCAEQGEATRQ